MSTVFDSAASQNKTGEKDARRLYINKARYVFTRVKISVVGSDLTQPLKFFLLLILFTIEPCSIKIIKKPRNFSQD